MHFRAPPLFFLAAMAHLLLLALLLLPIRAGLLPAFDPILWTGNMLANVAALVASLHLAMGACNLVRMHLPIDEELGRAVERHMYRHLEFAAVLLLAAFLVQWLAR